MSYYELCHRKEYHSKSIEKFGVIYNQRDRIHFKSTFAAVGLERRPPTRYIYLIFRPV